MNYSLIATTAEAMVFKMHRLVQLSTQAWLQACGRLKQWKCRFISNLNDDIPKEHPLNVEDLAKGRRIYVPTLAALEIELESTSARLEQASLLYTAGIFAICIGDDANAAKMLTRSLDLRTALLGDGNQHTMDTMYDLVYVLIYQCQWKEAEDLTIKELRATMRLHGPYHTDTLWSKNSLASIYRAKRQLQEAEELQAEILDTAEQMLGHEHRTTLFFMSELARVYDGQGRLQEAEKLHAEALRVMELSRPGDRRALGIMGSLAGTYVKQGRLQDAKQLYVKLLDMSKRMLGDRHPFTIHDMSGLASIFQRTERWQSASDLIDFCIATSESVSGLDFPSTIKYLQLKEDWKKERMSKSGEFVANEQSVGDGEVER